MNFKSISILLIAHLIFMNSPVWSEDLIVYPAKGQSNDQMEKDKFECYTWAKGQTGLDPMAMPQATSPPPQRKAKQGGVGRGAVREARSDWPRAQLPEIPAKERPSVRLQGV